MWLILRVCVSCLAASNVCGKRVAPRAVPQVRHLAATSLTSGVPLPAAPKASPAQAKASTAAHEAHQTPHFSQRIVREPHAVRRSHNIESVGYGLNKGADEMALKPVSTPGVSLNDTVIAGAVTIVASPTKAGARVGSPSIRASINALLLICLSAVCARLMAFVANCACVSQAGSWTLGSTGGQASHSDPGGQRTRPTCAPAVTSGLSFHLGKFGQLAAGLAGVSRAPSAGRAAKSIARAATAESGGQGAASSSQAVTETVADVASGAAASISADGAAVVAGGGREKRGVTLELVAQRMLTRADFLKVHAITGTLHMLVGLVYLVDLAAADVSKITGGTWSPHVPIELVLLSMAFGAVNAASGLQPTLLPRPYKNVLQLLGFGEGGNLSSAGFVNVAAFYFWLTYQSLRGLPDFPVWAHSFDMGVGALTLLTIAHTVFIINGWVKSGLSQGFAIAMSLPVLLNLPVSTHLLFEGQAWVQNLSIAYPGWPEAFFAANYAIAWAGSGVALVLTLYERRVIDLTQRLLLTLVFGAITFAVVPLEAYVHIPQWFQGQWQVMLTLTPPQ